MLAGEVNDRSAKAIGLLKPVNLVKGTVYPRESLMHTQQQQSQQETRCQRESIRFLDPLVFCVVRIGRSNGDVVENF